jgi:hypothetical protein
VLARAGAEGNLRARGVRRLGGSALDVLSETSSPSPKGKCHSQLLEEGFLGFTCVVGSRPRASTSLTFAGRNRFGDRNGFEAGGIT